MHAPRQNKFTTGNKIAATETKADKIITKPPAPINLLSTANNSVATKFNEKFFD